MKRHAIPLLLAAAIAAGACGGSSTAAQTPTALEPTPAAQTVAVAFTYRAATAVDPAVDYASCSPTGVVFETHLRFIWNSWDDRRYTVAGPDLFEYTADIPVGQDLRTALHDPNTCLGGDVYVAPGALYANGVLLTRVERVQDGTGLAFRVGADGTVTPKPDAIPRPASTVPARLRLEA